MVKVHLLALFAALALMGCDEVDDSTDTAPMNSTPTGTNTGATTGTNTGTTTGTATGTTSMPSSWSTSVSPCYGSGTSALLCDDDQACYVGCGETADGTGLHLTTDGGATWTVPYDIAGGFFSDYRVMDLTRDGDLLYVAGTSNSGSHRVVSLDTTTGALVEVYMNIFTIDHSLTAGSYARTDDGTEIAESLTGSNIVIRKPDAGWQATHANNDGWAAGYGWWLNTDYPNNVQILDMAVANDKILGVGAQINELPTVYLPPRSWAFATDSNGDDYIDQLWETVALADGFSTYDGECWGIDANGDGLAVVCVNQTDGAGMVYTIGSDWETTAYDLANWTSTSASNVVDAALVAGHSTWNEGVCRGPNNELTVVGRDSQADDGYLMRSTDGGATWTELTSDVVAVFGAVPGPINRCVYTSTHLVLSGSGIFASAALTDL